MAWFRKFGVWWCLALAVITYYVFVVTVLPTYKQRFMTPRVQISSNDYSVMPAKAPGRQCTAKNSKRRCV